MAKTRSADRQRYWREVIERQRASGQSIVGFCSKEGLSPASFHAWKRRLGRPQRGTGRRRRSRPSFRCRSSATQRLAWEGWKSSGLAASCCESRAVTYRRSARWWLLSGQPRQHEGHVHADVALVPASVCENRPHRYAKVVRGAGWSGGARTGPAGGIGRPVPLLQPAGRSREGTLVCGRRLGHLVQAIGRRNL